MLWQHDENVMLERSVATVSTVSLEPFCVCMCVGPFPPNTTGDYHALWVMHLAGVLLRGGPHLHYSLIALTPTATWDLESEFELYFNANTPNQIGFRRTEA